MPGITDIDTNVLTDPVRQALLSSTAKISHWEYTPIHYINTETRNLGLHRFQGVAEDNGETRPWSIVLKAVDAPLNPAAQSYWNYHRREILAYESGLLSDLPDGISAPRCLGVTEYLDGICWLWLEDVQEAVGQPWSLSEFGLAAFRLGRFNGAYLTGRPIPSFPWLSQKWVHGWLNEYRQGNLDLVELIQDEHFWEHPLLQPSFPNRITEEICKLWDQHDSLLDTLEQLPQTFCHMDAYQPNLFLRRDAQGTNQVVAIDWVFAGKGAVGEEIANLLAASLIWFEYNSTDAKSLDEEIFSNYLRGLHQAGWDGDSRYVRLGYTAACALRWGGVGMWWLLSFRNSKDQAELETKWGRPIVELVSQWSKTVYYVLELSQESYELQRALF
jgi:hypothetical protein